MSIQKYEALLKIVEIGNITKAALEMSYSQSAMSHILNSLEADWGIKILNRDRQGVRLTPEGEALLPAIQDIVDRNQALLQKISEMQSLEHGIIRIGAFPSALNNLLPSLLTSFAEQYPAIAFHVQQGGYHDVEQLIHVGRLDCGFVTMPTKLPIQCIPVCKDRLLAIFPEGTRVEQEHFPVKDIEQESFIMIKEIDREVLDILKRQNIRIGKRIFSDYDYSVLPMVAGGLGMCILPELLLRGTPHKLEIKELDPPAFRTIGIGYKEELLSSATRRFLDHANGWLRDTPFD